MSNIIKSPEPQSDSYGLQAFFEGLLSSVMQKQIEANNSDIPIEEFCELIENEASHQSNHSTTMLTNLQELAQNVEDDDGDALKDAIEMLDSNLYYHRLKKSEHSLNLAIAAISVLSGSAQLSLLLTVSQSILRAMRILYYGKNNNDAKLAPSSDIAIVLGAIILALKDNKLAAGGALMFQSFKLIQHCINNKENMETLSSGVDFVKEWFYGEQVTPDFIFPENVEMTDAVVAAIKKEYKARKPALEYFQSESSKQTLAALDKYTDKEKRRAILVGYLTNPDNKGRTLYEAAIHQLWIFSTTCSNNNNNLNSTNVPKSIFFAKKCTLIDDYQGIINNKSVTNLNESLELYGSDYEEISLDSDDEGEEDCCAIKQNTNITSLKM